MKSYGENPAPTTPRPSNTVTPPERVSRVTMGEKTFPLAKSVEQVRQNLRKRYDIAELVANTPPEFLKDAWAEKAPDCPVCGEGFVLCNGEGSSEYCSECGTVLYVPEPQPPKYHYWLVSYVFNTRTGFGYGNVSIRTPEQKFSSEEIRLATKLSKQENVSLLNIGYLGHMTKEEFGETGELE